MGAIDIPHLPFHNTHTNPVRRVLGFFDPLDLWDGKGEAEQARLRRAELTHGRLAMLAAVRFDILRIDETRLCPCVIVSPPNPPRSPK